MFKINRSEILRVEYCIDQYLDLKFDDAEEADKYSWEARELIYEWNSRGLRYLKLTDGRWLDTAECCFVKRPDRKLFKSFLQVK